MIRVLFYLLIVFLLGLGFAWLADRPGDMVVTFEGYQYRVSLMVAAVAVTAIVASVMIGWWLVKALWNSPYSVARYFRVRRRDRGYQALSTGMVAAGAGDAALARSKTREAAKLIRADQEPLVHLLDAQASLLEGDHDGARKKFEAMLDDPELRVLGLRGLYLEAERLGDRAAARHYAGRAADIAPQLGWAADSTIEQKTADGDWDGALRILDAQKTSRHADRKAFDRRRAVLLTAKAMAAADTDPSGARSAALEANRLQPDFVPAALIAARLLFRANETRKGAKILEAAWKADAHPQIGDLYVHARHGDAVNDRLNRARKLQAIKQNHAESAIVVARAALDCGDFALARKSAESAIRMQPREGAWLLLADIEEAATGDIGKVRECLARAVRAPRDPAWVADGIVSETWAPVSPVTGRLDAFEWRVPVERLGQIVEPDADILLPATAGSPAAPAHAATAALVEAEPAAEVEAKPATAAVPAWLVKPAMPPAIPEPTVASRPVTEPATDLRPVPEPANDPGPVADAVPEAEAVELATQAEAAVPMQAPIPDDPGVDPAEADRAKAPRRFRLF